MKTVFKILCVLSILAFFGGLKSGAVSVLALVLAIIFGVIGWRNNIENKTE